jgi:putative membrane protein
VTEPDIRFTLANERTFLAWVRTAIGLVAAGVAVFHLFDESAATTVLALVLLAAGALAGGVGYTHFRAADRAIRRGEVLPTRTAVVAVMTGAVLVAVVAGVASVLVEVVG